MTPSDRPVERCDQLTQRGDRCQRTATIESWVLRSGRLGVAGWERFCSQHANYYGVLRHRRCRPVQPDEERDA